MSRAGYSDDIDNWDLIRWRGAVKSSIRGKRGQAFLRELLEALDALPVKELTCDVLQENADGPVCALGAVGRKRGIDMSEIDPDNRSDVASTFGIAEALAAEIMFENDDDFGFCYYAKPPEDQAVKRYVRVRNWVIENLLDATEAEKESAVRQCPMIGCSGVYPQHLGHYGCPNCHGQGLR